MSRAAKRLEAMRINPAGDWSIGDIEVVCRWLGIDCVAPSRGSHYDVSHPALRSILTYRPDDP